MTRIQDFIKTVFDEQYLVTFGQEVPADSSQDLVLTREMNGELVAVLTAKKSLTNLHVTALVVSPAHQKKGLGASLLTQMEEEVKGLGVTSITLSTKSYQAEGFYRKQGYVCYASLADVPQAGVTKYHFIKYLV